MKNKTPALRKDGRYELKIVENSKRVSRYFRTLEDAEAWLEMQEAVKLGDMKAMQVTVKLGPLAEEWFAAKHGSIRQTTMENYRTLYDKHIAPAFAKANLKQVLEGWQSFINQTKQTHSASSVIKINCLLSCIMSIALDREMIKKLPRIIGLPTPAKRRPRPMTQEQLFFLVKAADKTRYGPALWLELATGLRRGELLALEWEDLDDNSVTINKSLERTKKGSVLQPPKTEDGYRTIPLDEWVVNKVRSMPRVKARGKPGMSPIIFCTVYGSYILPRNFSRTFAGWIKDANKMIAAENQNREKQIPLLTGRRFHDMRHQFGSWLADLSVHPSVAKNMTGHSKVDMVMHYTNPNTRLAKEAARGIGGKLNEIAFDDRMSREIDKKMPPEKIPEAPYFLH